MLRIFVLPLVVFGKVVIKSTTITWNFLIGLKVCNKPWWTFCVRFIRWHASHVRYIVYIS